MIRVFTLKKPNKMIDFNPFIGLGLEELELAYAYYSWCGDTDAIHMVADAFCLEAELEVFGDN